VTRRIVCLGDVMVDVLAILPGPLRHASDTPAPVTLGHGGSAANTAAWLAACGAPGYFVGRVGDDAFGREAVRVLVDQGVSPLVSIDPAAPTGVCIVLVSPDGERTMIPSSGANLTIRPADLGADLLGAQDHLHLSGYALLNEGSRETALFALGTAASVGASVSVDAASAGPIRAVGGAVFLDWLPDGALLLANADEVRALSPEPDDAAALDHLVERGLTVVLKRGGEGALVASGADRLPVPATPVPAVDTTGAGDAFAAGVLAALHHGSDLVEAVRQGNALGARAVSQVGARPGRPRAAR